MAQPVWNTSAGSLGTFPSRIALNTSVNASAVLPAVSITYMVLSGSLPPGVFLSKETGVISGIPELITEFTTYTFTIRATDNYANLRDRTFSIGISSEAAPQFTTQNGNILITNDSVWVDLLLQYSNPDPTNPVTISLVEGILPIGLEINEAGRIRGYAEAPVVRRTYRPVTTAATLIQSPNIITCLSTSGFEIGRPVIFSGTVFGGIVAGRTYYIKAILGSTRFSISATQNGTELALANSIGFMNVTLPDITTGQPIIRTFSFTLLLDSPLGSDLGLFSITVVNQNTPTSQGGPGYPYNTRMPTIYNTRPPTYQRTEQDPYYGYYVLPPIDAPYDVYPLSTNAFIGTFRSDEYFSFKVIGKDFDKDELTYVYSSLPLGLVGDPVTGWITGTPSIGVGVNQYSFSVAVQKSRYAPIQTPFFRFTFNISNEIEGNVTWITPNDLGIIYNGNVSTKNVVATSDVELAYRITEGSLPPNLFLLDNGEISGYAADQPSDTFLIKGDSTTFTFTIQAYSPKYPFIFSDKTFTLTVKQQYSQPTDILYMKATPSVQDRHIIESLLNDDKLILPECLYRPNDKYFGKATSVIYNHAYGIYASDLVEYLSSVTENHYWRNITLGELKTAVAKDEEGNIVYEVVYSSVIDNLVNPKGVSVSRRIVWPTKIDLSLGPWYTSSDRIFTSYTDLQNQDFYTSLTPGYARVLYPNSLYNMRTRVAKVLGQEYDSNLLPLWMTSQQADGNTLGFTQAWVICYTKPYCSEIIKNNINNNWPYKLNQINFQIDRFSVNKSITYNYDKNTNPPSWTELPSGDPVPDPLDSKDFYVLFPRETILPDKTQY